MKKEIVYLVGLPCSGKSTYIKENYKDYAIISNDAIIEEYAKNNGIKYNEAWKSVKNDYVLTECQKRFQAAVKMGRPILIDNTNMTVKSRSKYEAKGYQKNAIVFLIDDAERQRRAQKRANETGKLVPESAIDKMKSIFKMPTFSEGFSNITVVETNGNQVKTKRSAVEQLAILKRGAYSK